MVVFVVVDDRIIAISVSLVFRERERERETETGTRARWIPHSMRRLTFIISEVRVEDAVQATAYREARVFDSEIAGDGGPVRIVRLEEAADEWRSVALERRDTKGVSSANTRAPDEASVEAFTPEDGVVGPNIVARFLELTWAAVESLVLSTTCSHTHTSTHERDRR